MSDNEPLLEHLTVYETLKFSLLIMNPSMTTTSVNATASLTAKNLGLERCYETFVKDLSWGERKRLQVGQQVPSTPLKTWIGMTENADGLVV
jgi:ABC-type multidrug transport system ATPase subunit